MAREVPEVAAAVGVEIESDADMANSSDARPMLPLAGRVGFKTHVAHVHTACGGGLEPMK